MKIYRVTQPGWKAEVKDKQSALELAHKVRLATQVNVRVEEYDVINGHALFTGNVLLVENYKIGGQV